MKGLLLFLMLILSGTICFAQLPAPRQTDTLIIMSVKYNYDDIDRENWPYHVIYKSTTFFEFAGDRFEILDATKLGDEIIFTVAGLSDKNQGACRYTLTYIETDNKIEIGFSDYEFICYDYNQTVYQGKSIYMTEDHNEEELYNSDNQVMPLGAVEVRPSFNGGDANEFSKWVNERLVYPKIAKENGVQGRVTLQFTIDTDGTLCDVKVLRGVDSSLDMEAVRVVSMSPKWKPGMQEGRPVKVTYTYPVIFQLR